MCILYIHICHHVWLFKSIFKIHFPLSCLICLLLRRTNRTAGWWKRRVQSLFQQTTSQQTIRTLPELHDAAVRWTGGPSGPGGRQSDGGRRKRVDNGQQWPSKPQRCDQRPRWFRGPAERCLTIRTGFTTWADTVTSFPTAHGVEGDELSLMTLIWASIFSI